MLKFYKKNNIKNVFLIGRWSLYTDGNYDGLGMLYLTTKDNFSLDKFTSRLNFEKSLRETIIQYQKIDAKVYILAQIPQQKIDGGLLYMKLYFYDVTDKKGHLENIAITKNEH